MNLILKERIPQGYLVLKYVNIKHIKCFLVRQWWLEKFLYFKIQYTITIWVGSKPLEQSIFVVEKKGWGRGGLPKTFLVSQTPSCHCACASQNSSGTSQASPIQASSAPASDHKLLPQISGFEAHLHKIPGRIFLEKQDLCGESYLQTRKCPVI